MPAETMDPSKENDAADEAEAQLDDEAPGVDDIPELAEGADVDEDDVVEHLKDSVEGSFRLKRLLTRDDDESDPKRKKLTMHGPEGEQKVKNLLAKWGMVGDAIVTHVLDQVTVAELSELEAGSYVPDKYNQWKSASDLLCRHICELRERKMTGGGPQDSIANFLRRHKLGADKDKILRALAHKDLRYVFDHYDGKATLEEVVEEAKKTEPVDENNTTDACPYDPGVATYARFGRLELIDPLADCAVFGDANLTFAMKLAKHRRCLGHVGRVIATTFEDLETLRERYKEIDESIEKLETDFAEVFHEVDCTRIAVNPKFKGLEGSLGAVYYNFPHSGAIQGFFDGHPVVNWRHENLMRLFFRALRSFVKPGGSVKVASNMGAVGVRYSYIVGGALENEFEHVETFPFLEWCLHRYGRSYGDRRDAYKRPDSVNNQSYNAQSAERDMVYCFRYAPTGKSLPAQEVRLPPGLKTLMQCEDGPFKNIQAQARKNLAISLHKRFVTEVSGVHVG